MKELQQFDFLQTPSEGENELLKEFLSEDNETFGLALRKIEESFGPMIRGVWRKQGVTNPDLQDDLLQDLMIRLVEKRAQFRGESKLTTWIISIAKNLAPNALQSKMYRPWKQYVTMNDGDTLDGTVDDPEHYPFEVSEMLSVLVENLADEYRAVVPLLMEGKSYTDMAQILNVPLGTIRSRVFAIHRKIDEIATQLEKSEIIKKPLPPPHITSRVA